MTGKNEDLRRNVLNELAWDPTFDATHIGVAADNGVVTLTGHGPDREGDAAASLAATVIGVRTIRLTEPRRHDVSAEETARSTASEWSVDTWVCPPSSGTGVDQL